MVDRNSDYNPIEFLPIRYHRYVVNEVLTVGIVPKNRNYIYDVCLNYDGVILRVYSAECAIICGYPLNWVQSSD